MRLARRLAGQGTNTVSRLQAIPVRRIRHLLIRSAVDRIAGLVASQRALRHLDDVALLVALGGTTNATEWLAGAQAGRQLQQWMLALTQHYEVEGSELEHEIGPKRRFHSTGYDDRTRSHPPHDVG